MKSAAELSGSTKDHPVCRRAPENAAIQWKSSGIADRPVRKVLTGVASVDQLTSGLSVSSLTCFVGRPCMGKTRLLLEVAASFSRVHRCNVVYCSAREPARMILASLEGQPEAELVAVGAEHSASAIQRARSQPPAVYCLDVSDLASAFRFTEALLWEGFGHCGMLVVDGLSCYVRVPMPRHQIIDGVVYYCDPDSLYEPTVLSAGELEGLHTKAMDYGIPVLVGIQTAENEAPWLGPRTSDLLPLERPVFELAECSLWLHRPWLYDKDLARGQEPEMTIRTKPRPE